MIRTHAAIATKWEARWKVRRIGFCEAMTKRVVDLPVWRQDSGDARTVIDLNRGG